MWNPFQHKKASISTEQKKKQARAIALKKLASISKNKDQQKTIIELQTLLHEFLKTYFTIRSAVTNEELADEIFKKKIDHYLKKKTLRVLERINEARYCLEHSNQEIKALIEDAQHIITLL